MYILEYKIKNENYKWENKKECFKTKTEATNRAEIIISTEIIQTISLGKEEKEKRTYYKRIGKNKWING